MTKVLNEAQFRGLVRKMVTEYVANDDQNPHKKVHADPSARNWDSGLDEEDSSDLSQGPGTEEELNDVGVEVFNCNACGYSCREDHPDYSVEYVCPECGHDNSMDDENGMSPTMDLGEADEDHSETHGGKRVGDKRWDDHADPTARNWDSGLE